MLVASLTLKKRWRLSKLMDVVSKLYKHVTKYQHVERIGNSEVQGLLQGTVWIQEKIDGANLSVSWDREASNFILCSRNNAVAHGGEVYNKTFQPAYDYIVNEPQWAALLQAHPHIILRCEFMTKHKIPFKDEWNKKVVIYDVEQIFCGQDEDINESPRYTYIPYRAYRDALMSRYSDLPWLEAVEVDQPTIEQLQELSKAESQYAEYREGIVIKNYGFTNKYGRTKWGKVISPVFDEKKALKARAKLEVGELEAAFVDKFVTQGYVEKEIHKIRDEKGDVSTKDMGRIIGCVPYEIFQDEMWRFLGKNNAGTFNFRLWRAAVIDKVREHALNYFNGSN
jgi:hypothetical protein